MINLQAAAVTYPGDVQALKPTTLAIERGRFTVLLGRSGSGKSTLLRAMNGLVSLSRGSISATDIGQLDTRAALRAHRRATGVVYQHHQLIGRLSALSNVLMGRLPYHGTLRSMFGLPDADRRLALECLERVGLLEKSLARVDTLSGGQQQRVGIARALAQRPRLILADEPIASLDPATSSEVLELLKSICERDGITTVVSLHQVEFAQAYADRILGMSQGRIVFNGPPASVNDAAVQALYAAPVASGRTQPAEELIPPSLVMEMSL